MGAEVGQGDDRLRIPNVDTCDERHRFLPRELYDLEALVLVE